MDTAEVRKNTPALNSALAGVHLNAQRVPLMARHAYDALYRHLQTESIPGGLASPAQHLADVTNSAAKAAARLFHGEPSDVAVITSAASMLQSLCFALGLVAGDIVVRLFAFGSPPLSVMTHHHHHLFCNC